MATAEDEVTKVVSKRLSSPIVTGIGAKSGFAVVTVKQFLMHPEVGILAAITKAFAEAEISIDHLTTTTDSVSVIVFEKELEEGKLAAVATSLSRNLELFEAPFSFLGKIALISIVGEGMVGRVGIISAITGVLAEKRISITGIFSSPGASNITIAVPESDMKKTVNTLYDVFFAQPIKRD